ncbi:hypothetical protein D9M71_449160 [compost metagenome]
MDDLGGEWQQALAIRQKLVADAYRHRIHRHAVGVALQNRHEQRGVVLAVEVGRAQPAGDRVDQTGVEHHGAEDAVLGIDAEQVATHGAALRADGQRNTTAMPSFSRKRSITRSPRQAGNSVGPRLEMIRVGSIRP